MGVTLEMTELSKPKPSLDKNILRYMQHLEKRYRLVDLTSEFRTLVNFSLGMNQPYHRWARYREGYSATLVQNLIKQDQLTKELHFILDPMCGSGTTLVACSEIGFDSLGLDVNAFSIDLTRAKITPYSKATIAQIRALLASPFLKGNVNGQYKKIDMNNDFAKYFDKKSYGELLEIKKWINKMPRSRAKDLLFTAWLCIIEDCSQRKKDGNGLATVIRQPKNVREEFKQKVSMLLEDITTSPISRQITSEAYAESALNMELAVEKFQAKSKKELGAIIFSPPYANSFDYFESYKMELMFGDYVKDLTDLERKRKDAVRNYRLRGSNDVRNDFELVNMVCDSIWEAIPIKEAETGKRDGRTRLMPNMIKAYFTDMDKIIGAMAAVLSAGKKGYIVVDQSSYVGVVVPTDLIFGQLAEDHGFVVEEVIKCRKANTSGQQLKRFPYLKEMLRESIVVLRKK